MSPVIEPGFGPYRHAMDSWYGKINGESDQILTDLLRIRVDVVEHSAKHRTGLQRSDSCQSNFIASQPQV